MPLEGYVYAMKVDGWTTDYQFLDGRVTGGSKPEVNIQVAAGAAAHEDIKRWVATIDGRINPVTTPLRDMKVEMERTATQTKLEIKIAGVLLADWLHTRSTGNIKFSSRPAFDLSWPEYKLWREIAGRFYQLAQGA